MLSCLQWLLIAGRKQNNAAWRESWLAPKCIFMYLANVKWAGLELLAAMVLHLSAYSSITVTASYCFESHSAFKSAFQGCLAVQLQCFHIDLSKCSWSLKQVSIFLYLLLDLWFKQGLGSKMVTASKRRTFGRTWNTCSKAKGCCQPPIAVKVIFSGTVLWTVFVHFCSAVCWGKALPC